MSVLSTKENSTKEKTDEITSPNQKKPEIRSFDVFIKVLAILIFSLFTGYGFGGGLKVSQKIKSGNFKLTHKLVFIDNEELKIRLVSHNSQYVFYVLENKNHITISPIQGNIKQIDKLNKSK